MLVEDKESVSCEEMAPMLKLQCAGRANFQWASMWAQWLDDPAIDSAFGADFLRIENRVKYAG